MAIFKSYFLQMNLVLQFMCCRLKIKLSDIPAVKISIDYVLLNSACCRKMRMCYFLATNINDIFNDYN